jgi:hypothetical protein
MKKSFLKVVRATGKGMAFLDDAVFFLFERLFAVMLLVGLFCSIISSPPEPSRDKLSASGARKTAGQEGYLTIEL